MPCLLCGDTGWICEDHVRALDDCSCGAAEKPCRCNPEASLPDGFECRRYRKLAALKPLQHSPDVERISGSNDRARARSSRRPCPPACAVIEPTRTAGRRPFRFWPIRHGDLDYLVDLGHSGARPCKDEHPLCIKCVPVRRRRPCEGFVLRPEKYLVRLSFRWPVLP
jgi:hypothetical protein